MTAKLLLNSKTNKIDILYYIFISLIILIGLYLRIKLYLAAYSFWTDEIYLGASFTDRGIKEMFGVLDFIQKVPPFFCICCLLVTKIAGFSVLSLRFIPLLAGLSGIFVFYYLLTLIFKNKVIILTALTLFSINIPLIYFSQEFKNYSCDVLIFLILLIVYLKTGLKKITNKQIIIYTLITIILLLTSYITAFIIPALIIAKSIEEKHFNYKTLFIFIAVISVSIYYYYTYQNLINELSQLLDFSRGFIEFNKQSFNTISEYFFEFYIPFFKVQLYPHLYILLLCGLVFLFIENRKIFIGILCILIVQFICSYLRIFPLTERCIIYFVPLMIIFMVKTAEYIFSKQMGIKYINIVISIGLLIFIFYINNFTYSLKHLTKYDLITFRCPLYERVYKENIAEYFLRNYKPGEKIFYTYEMQNLFKYYSKIFNIEKELNYSDKNLFKTGEETKVELSKFIKENKGEYWIVGRNSILEDDFNYNSTLVKDELKRNRVKFKEYIQDYLYIFHVE